MTALSNQVRDVIQGHRIMVIGQDVAMVQQISRYCLDQGAEVFPYYGTPKSEEVALFDPEVSILCSPIPADFLDQIDHPYIVWSEPTAYAWQDFERNLRAAFSPFS